MARFRATIQGHRGEASRLGHKRIEARVASWSGAVSVQLYEHEGQDWATADLVPHHNKGSYRKLYEGPVSGMPKEASHG